MEKPFRGPVLSKGIQEYVKQYILEHKLSEGDSLPTETQLAQELGVARGSVREAIKALQSLGIVEVRRGNGLFVREYNFDPVFETLSYNMLISPTRLSELFQIRLWLERAVIGEAVTHIGPEDIDELDELIKEWEKRSQAKEPYADLDKQFHFILYKTLNNQSLIKLFEVFWTALIQLNLDIYSGINEAQEEIERHRAIIEAVKAGDAALAQERLIRHFDGIKRRIDLMIEVKEAEV